MNLFDIQFDPTWFHIGMGIILLCFLGSVARILNSRRDMEIVIHDRVLEAKQLRKAYEEDVVERQQQIG